MPIKMPPPPLTTIEGDDDDRNNFNANIPMSVAQATQFLGYRDVHVVLNLLNSGELKGHRVGRGKRRRWLIWKHDLIAYINRQSNQHNGQNGTMGGGGD